VPTTTRLNQINALVKGTKAQTLRTFTDLHRTVGKAPLLSGISRTYQPRDDEGERLPSESTRVQVTVDSVLPQVSVALGRLFDLQLTQDATNCVARADVVVDGATILADAPVTYLLFLEKQLTDLRTFVDGLPTLDAAERWEFSDGFGCYASEPAETVRTKKVPRNHVRAEATAHHPAQVDVYMEDVPQGTWTTVKLSGAMPADRVRQLRTRIAALIDAVKIAREAANTITVEDRKAGEQVFGYLFG
jgi:hypothetical protein